MALNRMIQSNQQIQQLQQVIDYVKKNGGDAKSLFYAMAEQKGKNPDQILQQAQNMMNVK